MDYDDKGMPVSVINLTAFEKIWWRIFFRLAVARFLVDFGIPLVPEFLVGGVSSESSSPDKPDKAPARSRL